MATPTQPTNIFAYTAPGADFPPYLSINRVGATVEVTVRSPKERGGYTALIALPAAEYERMRASLPALDQEHADYAFMGVDQPSQVKV